MEEEYVDLIDEDENIIKSIPKEESRTKNLLRRGADALIFNSEGKLLIHKRAAVKKAYANRWALRIGGWVISGETPDEAIVREIEEEIGAKNTKPKFLFKYRYKSKHLNNDISYLYKLIHNGPVVPLEEEISEYKWVDVKELDKVMQELEFSIPCMYVYNNFKEKIIEAFNDK